MLHADVPALGRAARLRRPRSTTPPTPRRPASSRPPSQVKAPYAYGTLSVEQGTHRLVRISPFDNQGRRQTTFAGVEVLPVVEQTDHVDIPDDEIRVDVYRSSGPGRPGRQHHRLRRPDHPPARPASSSPARTSAVQIQNRATAHGGAAGQAAGAPPAGGAGRDGRAQGRRRLQLGQPDALLRAAPVPDGQGPAHRVRGRQPAAPCSTATSTASSRPASAGSAPATAPRPERHRSATPGHPKLPASARGSPRTLEPP